MNTATNLKQSELKVNVEGVVSEIALVKNDPNRDSKKIEPGVDNISGTVTVKTDDTNFIRFMVSVNSKTKAGADNKIYAGIETVMTEYKSIADVGEEEADKVRITNGDLNPFTSRNDGSPQIGYKTNFFNRIKGEYNPHAEFEAEIYISGIVPEMDKDGDETGRILVKGWGVTYSSIEPITLIAPKELADAVESTYEVGQTAKFFGDIINSRVEKITEIPMAIGKPKQKVETSYKNELIITGASEPYDEENAYKADSIKLAIQERENAKANEKTGDKNPFTSTPSGASKGRTLNW
jgi:hypothetical protein